MDDYTQFGVMAVIVVVVTILVNKVIGPLIEHWRDDSIAKEMRDSIATLAATVATLAESQAKQEVRIEMLERDQGATATKLESVVESLNNVAIKIHGLIEVMQDRENR